MVEITPRLVPMELSPVYQDLVHRHVPSQHWGLMDTLNPMLLGWKASGATFHEALSALIAGLLSAAENHCRRPGEFLKMVEVLTNEAAVGIILAGYLWRIPPEVVGVEAQLLPRTIRAYAFPEASPLV